MPDTHAIRAFLDEAHLDHARRVAEACARTITPLPAPEDDAAARAQARELLAIMGREGLYAPIATRVAAVGDDRDAVAFDARTTRPGPRDAPRAASPTQDLRACALTREALAATSPLADAVWALQALGCTPL